MDTFVDSAWYFLRYCDPDNDRRRSTAPIVDYWNPVDLYIGGVDHATMHMIYARFWMKVLNDLGYIGFREPFASFFSNGWVTTGGRRRSRSGRGNGSGRTVIERYGADAGRLASFPRPGRSGHGVDGGGGRGDGALRPEAVAGRQRGRRARRRRARGRRRSRGRRTRRSRR